MSEATPKPNTFLSPADEPTPWLLLVVALGVLLAIFVWVYARFAGALYFGMDDFIETEYALAKPLGAVITDAFAGTLSWSGFRPVAYSLRAVMAHLFGAQEVSGYHLVGMGVHFLNTLLTFHIVWRVARRVIPAFVAAAFFLLLPAHNEAVLYMSANANLFALFFALLAVEAGVTPALHEGQGGGLSSPIRWLLVLAAAFAYLLAILTYEVTLPLIFLLLLADWRITTTRRGIGTREFMRRRAGLYGALAAAAVVALGMRFWAGSMAPERTDYGISLAPAHLLKGYSQLLSQMVLLLNSPWKHLPDYVYNREWMSPSNPRALASMALVGAATVGTLWLALRRRFETEGARNLLFWLGWGALWVLAISLPFVMLAGRDPENRYTYIPSFGAAVVVGVFFLWLFGWVARQSWRRVGRWLIMLLAALWLGIYGWVTTSDVAEFARAGAHARAFLQGIDELVWDGATSATLAGANSIAQVGVPFDIGSAYVFSTDEALKAAMRLHGVPSSLPVVSGDLALGALASANSLDNNQTLLLGYDRQTNAYAPIATAYFCSIPPDDLACRKIDFASVPAADNPQNRWLYVQVYNAENAPAGGTGMIVEGSTTGSTLRSCWHFVDHERVQVDPATFSNAAVAARCQANFDIVLPLLTALSPDTP
jgi:hypothetical protein